MANNSIKNKMTIKSNSSIQKQIKGENTKVNKQRNLKELKRKYKNEDTISTKKTENQ